MNNILKDLAEHNAKLKRQNRILEGELLLALTQIRHYQGIIQANTKERGELQETIIRQARDLEKFEVSEIERSWNK